MVPLLAVRNLRVEVAGRRSPVVDGVSFELPAASIAGLFGESGCGKTTLARSLLNLLPPRFRTTGSVRLDGREILGLPESEWERIRGGRLSLVPQDPGLALNPVLRIGTQLAETIRAHKPTARRDIAAAARSSLELAGIQEVRRIASSWPHQLSGGERQRAAIAQALACRPALAIADEPFSALDPIRVVRLSALFQYLAGTTGTAFLLISHDPGVLARTAAFVMVMHAGRIVEQGDAERVLRHPSHPYTAGLLHSMEGIRGRARE